MVEDWLVMADEAFQKPHLFEIFGENSIKDFEIFGKNTQINFEEKKKNSTFAALSYK